MALVYSTCPPVLVCGTDSLASRSEAFLGALTLSSPPKGVTSRLACVARERTTRADGFANQLSLARRTLQFHWNAGYIRARPSPPDNETREGTEY